MAPYYNLFLNLCGSPINENVFDMAPGTFHVHSPHLSEREQVLRIYPGAKCRTYGRDYELDDILPPTRDEIASWRAR